MSDLPTAPGPYFWRATDECEWDSVYVREDSTVPGYEYTVLFPETGVEIDLPDLQGQWAKAHKPDEGIDAWAVFDQSKYIQCIGYSSLQAKEMFMGTPATLRINEVEHLWKTEAENNYTCEPVTIFRNQKHKVTIYPKEKE